MTIDERNSKVKGFINRKITKVKELSEDYFQDLDDYQTLTSTLDNLINVNAKGFRGIVVTAIAGLDLDVNYNPLSNFYDCNPRAIFENGIWYALQDNNIPCGKSDPLNVAKNTNELNKSWAKGKRPEKSAFAVISYLEKIINETDAIKKDKIIDYFFYRLVKYSEEIENLPIYAPEKSAYTRQSFADKLIQFILDYPESGTTPQLVIGYLLESIYQDTQIIVKGHEDSVFGTNATAKKPADIWLEKDENLFNLYEITVKKIDYKRLDDCIDSLIGNEIPNQDITFICRIPPDISSLEVTRNDEIDYKNISFSFIDISQFIKTVCALLSLTQIENIIEKLRLFVEDVNRPVSTKEGWNNTFQ